MSKQNSKPKAIVADPKARAAYWRTRVFKNTYTRGGRRLRVKAWSVKLQHAGVRRTCSLGGATRAEAAAEAVALYQAIARRGWKGMDETSPRPSPGSVPVEPPRGGLAHWRTRLLQRQHAGPGEPGKTGEWSAHIEHEGTSHYFPLGAARAERAAGQALEIYREVTANGWQPACARFAREVTVAIYWASNPIAWTYATFHSRPGRARASVADGATAGRRWRVALVEPEPAVARGLAACVNADPRFVCVEPGGELERLDGAAFQLVLVNHALVASGRGEVLARLRQRWPVLPVVVYAVYEDSDQLFKATPGGAQGYLLKRTLPARVLEPIAGSPGVDTLSATTISRWARGYFQKLIGLLPADDATRHMTRLTPREQEILSLLSKGCVDKEIAQALRISPWTVHGHLKNIFEKLDVHSRTEAVVKFLQK